MCEMRGLAGLCGAAVGYGELRYRLVEALAGAIDALGEHLPGEPQPYAAWWWSWVWLT